MNLHAIAGPVIAAVNPTVPAVLRLSTGWTQGSGGRQVPTYAPDQRVSAQVQDLSQKDLMHLDGLNIQGSQKVIYLFGAVSAVSRVNQKGGDLVILSDGNWLTTAVIESWPGWCKVSVTQQLKV